MRRPVWLLLALLLVAATAGGWWWHYNTRPDRRLQRGLEACRRGDTEEARKIARALDAAGAPTHAAVLRAEILFRRARFHLDNDRRDVALPLLRDVVEELRNLEDPGALRADAAALVGQSLFYLGALGPAEQALLVTLAERPDHADAHRALAALYYDQGALALALEHLQEVSRLDPRDGRPDRLRGLIHKDMQQNSEAVACYEEALRRELPGSQREEVRIELAEVLVGLEQFSKALAVLAQLDPEEAAKEVPTVLRAESLAAEGRSDRLGECLARGLRLYPHSARLLRLQARLLVDEGKLEKALPLLEEAARGAPRDFAGRFELGRLYRRLGRAADAKEQDRLGEESRVFMVKMNELSHKASANPWDASVRLQLADLCHKLGIPELEEMWRRAAAACSRRAAPSGPAGQGERTDKETSSSPK